MLAFLRVMVKAGGMEKVLLLLKPDGVHVGGGIDGLRGVFVVDGVGALHAVVEQFGINVGEAIGNDGIDLQGSGIRGYASMEKGILLNDIGEVGSRAAAAVLRGEGGGATAKA